ncbi:hypothetical protein [Rossellomorea aquimaris]|uniref:hypothetical protein n=1 Tax=Rossellomorea aquimaris TaxID=189382 RepID=UPI0007D06568|nr:hypothetical protein [Rossellomorea aquimaris]
MPIPFIAAGVIAATAITGVGSGVKATKNTIEAKGLNQKARGMVTQAENHLNSRRELTNNRIEKLGEEKIRILSTSAQEFLTYFQLLKDVEFSDHTTGIEELKNMGVTKDLLNELEAESFQAVKVASGGLASLGSGVAAAYGAYAGTMLLGTASTGAPIAGLYGVAASNATLAWLGGGALSAGGFGMAGGTMVLGGIVAGPALAVGGLIMSAQSKKKLNSAYGNLNEAKVVAEQLTSAEKVLEVIHIRSIHLYSLLEEINKVFTSGIETMRNIISKTGTDWQKFNKEEKEAIHKVFLTAQLIKGIIDTPLLDEDGAITQKSAEVLESGQQALTKLQFQKTV